VAIARPTGEKKVKKEKMLLIGYNELLPGMLLELDHYVAEASMVTIAVDQAPDMEELEALKLKNIKISVQNRRYL